MNALPRNTMEHELESLQVSLPHRHLPPILRLSPDVRREIYLWAGLANINHNPDLLPAWDNRPFVFVLDGEPIERQGCNFFGLLVSCRTIYNEASALLYSKNRFIIRFRPRESFQRLRALTPSSLACLTSLKVVLNEASCHHAMSDDGYDACCDDEGRPGGSHCKTLHEEVHEAPATMSDQSTKHRLDEWSITAHHMSSHISPNTLELTFVCDVERKDVDAARSAVKPLLRLPPLANCHVRLCREFDPQLQQIAQDTVLQARGIVETPSESQKPSSPSSPTCHLLSLPRELRFRILEYTDVITPWTEVTWSRQRGYKFSIRRVGCINLDARGEECPPDVHNGCQFVKCGDPVDTTHTGCFCRLRHSAASDTCRCWAYPTDLFLVCRTLYQDVQVVFFSGNRFVVHDYFDSPPWAVPSPHDQSNAHEEYPFERFAASKFLREIVPSSCLGLLRSLEFVFPPYRVNQWPLEGSAAMLDWEATIYWAKDKLNLAGLILRLVMADANEWSQPEDRLNMTENQGQQILAAYNRIINPLTRWGPGNAKQADGDESATLAGFHARMAWPTKWTFGEIEDSALWEAHEQAMQAKERALNERAEKLVLGSEAWERQRNIPGPPTSLWDYAFHRDA